MGFGRQVGTPPTVNVLPIPFKKYGGFQPVLFFGFVPRGKSTKKPPEPYRETATEKNQTPNMTRNTPHNAFIAR